MNKFIYFFFFLFPYLACASIRIAFVGDSVTFGHLVKENERFSEVTRDLLKEKGIEIEVINKGVNCQTTEGSLHTVIDLVSHQKFEIVVIGAGINDASIKVPYEIIKDHYEKMINLLLLCHVKIIIGIVEPFYIIPAYTEIFHELYKHLAHKYPHLKFFALLSTDILQYHCIDIVHPNPEGHKIIADRLVKTLLPLVDHGHS